MYIIIIIIIIVISNVSVGIVGGGTFSTYNEVVGAPTVSKQ